MLRLVPAAAWCLLAGPPAVLAAAVKGGDLVHWGNASREDELACSWGASGSKSCKRAQKAHKQVVLKNTQVYVVDDFLNAREAAWLSTIFDDKRYVANASQLSAMWAKIDAMPPNLYDPIEELARRIHGHAVLKIQPESELPQNDWRFKGVFYPDDLTFRRYHRSQNRVQPHQDTGSYGRCLSATLHFGRCPCEGGDLETYSCRRGVCNDAGWQYDGKQYASQDFDTLLAPENLEMKARVPYKAGRLTFFLGETVHAVAPAQSYDRDILFMWFSCTPTILNGAAMSGHTKLVKDLVQQGAPVNAVMPNTGMTPAHFAATTGHAQVLATLAERRAELGHLNVLRQTPLEMAIEKGHLTVVRYLTRTLPEAGGFGDNIKLVQAAAKHGHVPILGELLGDDPEPVDPQLLQTVAIQGHCSMIRFLMKWTKFEVCTSQTAARAVRKMKCRFNDDELDALACPDAGPSKEQASKPSTGSAKTTTPLPEVASSEVENMCPEVSIPKSGVVEGFPLNASHMKLRRGDITLRVCEERADGKAGILAVEGFLNFMGGPGGVKAHTLGLLDMEIVKMLGNDVVGPPPLMPLGMDALRVAAGGDKTAAELRHGRHMATSSYASVLTFLNDQEDGLQGGHVLFPTMAKRGRRPDTGQEKLAAYLHKKFSASLMDDMEDRKLLERGGKPLKALEKMCKAVVSDRSTPYFAVRPRLGLALIVFHMVGAKGGPYTPETEHWHTTCKHNIQMITLSRSANLRAEEGSPYDSDDFVSWDAGSWDGDDYEEL